MMTAGGFRALTNCVEHDRQLGISTRSKNDPHVYSHRLYARPVRLGRIWVVKVTVVVEERARDTIWQGRRHGFRIGRHLVGGEEHTTLEMCSPASGGAGKPLKTLPANRTE